jgi:Zn-dependent protease with chaperone function
MVEVSVADEQHVFYRDSLMTLTWIVIIAGAVLFGLYLLGRMTPESKIRQPIIDTSTIPEWAKVLTFIVVIGAIILWLFGAR